MHFKILIEDDTEMTNSSETATFSAIASTINKEGGSARDVEV
jgi:hypothetical protein